MSRSTVLRFLSAIAQNTLYVSVQQPPSLTRTLKIALHHNQRPVPVGLQRLLVIHLLQNSLDRLLLPVDSGTSVSKAQDTSGQEDRPRTG